MNKYPTFSKPTAPEQPACDGLDKAPCVASCFVAGIVKGLIESGDPYKHFGSLMAFNSHVNDAIKCGVVAGGADDPRITDFGRKAYFAWDISKERGRAYMWRRKSFILPSKVDMPHSKNDRHDASI